VKANPNNQGIAVRDGILGCPVWQWPGHEAETEIETSEPFAENESFKPGVEE